jgi:Na+/H+ antiporter NhaD/arsenite permease-like protein
LTLFIIVGAAAFIAGAIIAVIVIAAAFRASEARRRKRKGQPAKNKRKIEFSKLVLVLVLLTYFVGVYIGVKISLIDTSQLGVLLAFIGTPTAAAIGFYTWKAKAENVIKIKKSNPEETENIPIDLNNINI